MGKDLLAAFDSTKDVFRQADEAISFPISKVFLEGPEEELRKTVNAQPALVTMSIACLTAARELSGSKLPPAAFMAGHSLGEYSALAATGAVDFPTAVFLSRERGRLMYEAGLRQPGTMAAVLGLDEAVLSEICKQTGAVIANINCPGQLAISGATDSVVKASEMAKARGAARVVPLQVSGAFHSPLMVPAVDGMKLALDNVTFRNPSVPIIGNVTAAPLTSLAEFKPELLTQLTSPVQWQKSVEYMLGQGVKTLIEIGPGKVLAGLIKRINREAEVINLGDAASIKAFAGA
jgi:[acyl-carrier-protein] S-malonyltransferase